MTTDPVREKEVNEAVESLDNSIGHLSALISDLEERLGSVLSTSVPTVSEDTPEAELCQLASTLRSMRYRVNRSESVVREILSRLEL